MSHIRTLGICLLAALTGATFGFINDALAQSRSIVVDNSTTLTHATTDHATTTPSIQTVALADQATSTPPVTAASTNPKTTTHIDTPIAAAPPAPPATTDPHTNTQPATKTGPVFTVPFYSQFADISSPKWQKVGCGITGLAMLIDYYKPAVSVDTLLQQGLAANAYLSNAGWTYAGLIKVAERYGVTGQSFDFGGASMDTAFTKLSQALHDGPVMVSVHYTFDPKNPIPHLVIANGIKDGKLYYNDPAAKSGAGSIPISTFQKAWKKRYITFWPTT